MQGLGRSKQEQRLYGNVDQDQLLVSAIFISYEQSCQGDWNSQTQAKRDGAAIDENGHLTGQHS